MNKYIAVLKNTNLSLKLLGHKVIVKLTGLIAHIHFIFIFETFLSKQLSE